MSFYVFAQDYCYTVNENQKSGLHQVSDELKTREEADAFAEKLANDERKTVYVMEVATIMKLQPAKVVKVKK
jgi:hypothetical protein